MTVELGHHFAAKLEPFLLMAKMTKGSAAAKLVQDATSAPGVFVFAELLQMPNIHELAASDQHAPHFALLQLFSYRTYRDYLENKDSLPPLNAAQVTKLRYLSIVSLASDRRILPYSLLLQELQMPTIRELEDLIIDAIYLDILRGKLDQKEQQLEIEYTMGRDLEPGRLDKVLATLQSWANITASVLEALDRKLVDVTEHHNAAQRETAAYEKQLFEKLKSARELVKKANILSGVMDVDDSMRAKMKQGRRN